MKTNQVMIRKMGDFDVAQRTKDGMFNATALLKQWNDSSGSKKNVHHYMENSSTKEFINALINDDEDIRNSERPINQIFTQSKVKTNPDGSKVPGELWMHPLLFIDFAMWINPTFKVKVLKFVYDKMLEYRNENCEAYKELSASVQTLVNPDFMRKAMAKVAEALNYIVFGSHEAQMRNKRGEEVLQKDLLDMEKKVATLINEGFIKSYEQLIDYLRRQWRERNTPKCLTIQAN